MVMKEATGQEMQEEVRVKRRAEPQVERMEAAATEEEIRARIEARIKSIEDEIYARASEMEVRPEFAEPQPWWDLLLLGPIQFPPFLQPSNVIATNELALFVSLLVVNPLPIGPGPISPLTILNGLQASLRYRTGNLETWTPSDPTADATVTINGVITPHFLFFTPTTEGVRDLSVSARIPGPGPAVWPFGGFASLLFNFDSEPVLSLIGLPGATPGFTNRIPCRFNVYQPD